MQRAVYWTNQNKVASGPADRPKLIVFDLDGTLVDTAPDLSWCGNEMLRTLGLPKRDDDSVRRWIGNGIERFVKRMLTNDMYAIPDETRYRKGIRIFEQLYSRYADRYSSPFPGVRQGLERIATCDLALACVTNKSKPYTRKILDTLGLAGYFSLVVDGDTAAHKKPHPAPLLYAARHFGVTGEECLFIGDSRNDVQAARAANFKVLCVPYGYNHGDDIATASPDGIVEDLVVLADLLRV